MARIRRASAPSNSATELNHYYYGAMDFRSGVAGDRFTYSCADDYTPVVLP